MENGNVSKEYMEQRLRDSPFHKARALYKAKNQRTCTLQVQNPAPTNKDVELETSNDATRDSRKAD